MSQPGLEKQPPSPGLAELSNPAQPLLPVFEISELEPDRLNYYQYGSCKRENLPQGALLGNTDIFIVDGRDDLMVRGNHDSETTVNDMHRIAAALTDAREAGIPVIPFEYYEADNGFANVVVPRLQGVNLIESIADPSPELVSEVDGTWSALPAYLRAQRAKGEPYSSDIFGIHQYMYAVFPGQTAPHVWMVDIGTYTQDPDNRFYAETYLENLASITASVVRLETTAGTELPSSRKSLQESFTAADRDTKYYRGIIRACEYMLKNGSIIEFDDEDSLPQELVF